MTWLTRVGNKLSGPFLINTGNVTNRDKKNVTLSLIAVFVTKRNVYFFDARKIIPIRDINRVFLLNVT